MNPTDLTKSRRLSREERKKKLQEIRAFFERQGMLKPKSL